MFIGARNGATPVPVRGTIVSGNGTVASLPTVPLTALIEGGTGGCQWSLETSNDVTLICVVYQSSNPNRLSEALEINLCNRPCAVRTPACAVADLRTNTARFAAPSSANTATATLGANNITLTTPATAPIVKTRMCRWQQIYDAAFGWLGRVLRRTWHKW